MKMYRVKINLTSFVQEVVEATIWKCNENVIRKKQAVDET